MQAREYRAPIILRIGNTRLHGRKIVYLLVALAVLVVWMYPAFLDVITAVKTNSQVMNSPLGLPTHPTLKAFGAAWNDISFGTLLRNSFILAIGAVVLGILISSVPAYAFSRYHIPGGDLIFLVLLMTLMLPQQTVIIPLYAVMNRLGLLNHLYGLIIVHAVYGMPFNMFVMRGFMAGVPTELEDAGRIDGCSDFGLYRRIMLPLSVPAIAVAATLNFINIWNEFFFAVVLLQSNPKYPITVGMITISQSQYFSSWNTPAAAVIMAQIPTILLYIFAHRYITRGFLAGAVKG